VQVGWKGAHHSGLAAVREDYDWWTTVTAQTGGHQRQFKGHRGVQHAGNAPGGVGKPGDGRRWATIGGAPQRNGGRRELATGAQRSS
jgi:hypothetical protein